MRRVLGLVLLGLFGFLITVGLLAQFYAPGQVKKTPLNINTVTNLTGEGAYLGEAVTPASVWQRTVAVGKKSTSSVAAMQNVQCVMKDPAGNAPKSPVCLGADDPNLINISEDSFATDRVTALAVNGSQYTGADAVPHEGLINKFPFDVRKKTYPFWDGTLGKAVDATYQGEEKVKGLSTYKFVISFADQPATIAAGTTGTYSDDKTMWIDPVTGSIINQTEHQVRKLDSGDAALDLTLAFTDATVQTNVDDANTNISQLSLIGNLPWVSYVLALLALGGGLLLMRGTSAASSARDDSGIDALIDSKGRRG